jgi:hypothetical protein
MPNLVYIFTGTLAQFSTAAATAGTTLNTNLAAGYVVASVVPYQMGPDGTEEFAWTLNSLTA